MPFEVTTEKATCSKCGTEYSRRKGYFPVSYAILHKGIGYVPVCKDCIDNMYNGYLAQCNDPKRAVRQMCRKLDLFWSDSVYEIVSRKSSTRSMMTQYIAKLSSITYAGKSYDDTLSAEGTLWNFDLSLPNENDQVIREPTDKTSVSENEEEIDIPEDVIAFWGSGYSPAMYQELEQRRSYYTSKIANGAELDIGAELLIRQICNLELRIAQDSAQGRSIDKSVNALNSLVGSLNIKPKQRKGDDMEAELTNTPLGVWLYRYENKRPLPDIDDSLKDVNHIKKYVFTWMGHLCKMLGIKNGYTRMYEEEMARLRVEKPEYDDEDDESLIIDSYSESDSDDDSQDYPPQLEDSQEDD